MVAVEDTEIARARITRDGFGTSIDIADWLVAVAAGWEDVARRCGGASCAVAITVNYCPPPRW